MQEGQVTVEGVTHLLPQPYMVIGTQLPYGGPGTYPLTSVQADRFLLRVWSDMATSDEERRIVRGIDAIERAVVTPAASAEDILSMREQARSVNVAQSVTEYALALVQHMRDDARVRGSLSARATIALHKCGRAMAFVDGRDYVIPDDVKALLPHVAHHRIALTSAAETSGISPMSIVQDALNSVPVPKTV
jgi:MoxR-like ATPase